MMILGVDDLLQFSSVQKYAAAILTLLDVDATPVKGHHAALALWADHIVSIDEPSAQ
jgi:hypothetical protein